MELSERHARTRAITRGTVSPANRVDPGVRDASQGVARVVSDVSVLCPRSVDGADNDAGWHEIGTPNRPLPRQALDGTSPRANSASTESRAARYGAVAGSPLRGGRGDAPAEQGRRFAPIVGVILGGKTFIHITEQPQIGLMPGRG
jgi:hypothetical protein